MTTNALASLKCDATTGFVEKVRFVAEIAGENASLGCRTDFFNKAATTRKRAQFEAFEFDLEAPGIVRVWNGSYGDEADEHSNRVNVEGGVPVACECPADQYGTGACKHRVAIAIRPPVLEAATRPDGDAIADGGTVVAPETQGESGENTDAGPCPHGNGEFCETGTDEPRPERCWPCFEDSRR